MSLLTRTEFRSLLKERVLVFDGAMGTSVHSLELPLEAYRGLENCTEILTETKPEEIQRIHESFLEVGADAVETNTFGANRLVLAEFDLQDQAYDLNVHSARLARAACEKYSTDGRPRFVVGSVGPGTKLVTLRQVTYDTLCDSYAEQIRGLIDGDADIILIETCQDILQTKCAVEAAKRAFDKCGRELPIMCQVTMETTGTMLMGTDIAAAVTTLEVFPEIDTIGLNCATGPREMSSHVRFLAKHSPRPISVIPNAGLPQLVSGKTVFPLTADELAKWLREFVTDDGVNIVGGCCGTTPEHIRAVAEAVRDVTPAARTWEREAAVSSLYQEVPMRQDNSFLIVGERCNTNGSRKFKRLLEEGDIESMLEMADEQVKEGAHVIDVCVDFVGRDGVPDMETVVNRFGSDVNVPLMLDSTEIDVLETGLKLAGGKCIVNSVNLEDGEEKLARVAALLRRYGAAVVALTIDEDPQEAMAKTADRKLEIAARIHDLLTNKYGVAESDIFFDCLTFPITTGNPEDKRLAIETLDGIERVMGEFPNVQSILGVSNVSFGLQPAARAVLNSAFLSEACKRGLTAAIVHAGKILPRNQISDERWNAALDLIYCRTTNGDPLEHYIGLFSDGESVGNTVKIDDLPIEERLEQRIVDGAKKGLEADLDEAMGTYNPLHIINNFLLNGMKTVGELFGAGKMQLPFVLKSAETMKTAVAHLEPHMERVEGQENGKIVLATVRGDVHDIGKNLVDIILTNNGFKVYNLGIKQPINNIINAWREHKADVIGLSGLLVKSTVIMRDDLAVLNEQNIDVPVILGGAALNRRYVEGELREIYNGTVYYAKDAFEGLKLMRDICEGTTEAPASVTAEAPAETVAQPSAKKAAPLAAKTEQTAKAAALAEAVAAGGDGGPPASVGGSNAEQLTLELEQRYGLKPMDDEAARRAQKAERAAAGHDPTPRPQSDIGHEYPVPRPPFWGRRVIEQIDLKAALAYMNETMLFQVQWGFRRKGKRGDEWDRFVNSDIRPVYRELVRRCLDEAIIRPQAVYGYWPANSDGDDLIIFRPPPKGAGDRPEQHGEELVRFTFPRQKHAPYWCLSDFWRPVGDGVTDVAAFHIVTAGREVSEIARQWFEANDYQQYLFLHGLGVETAEALAEMIHKQVRMELGVANRDARELQKLFKQGYQGSRYSFGYPACPSLEDQRKLMRLLGPEEIGITLSEECQLEPEQSTSAIITYHPDARYFNVRD